MIRPNLSSPHFESGSYGERAAAFFTEDQEWEKFRGERKPEWYTRAVTWAHHPYRYWLEQSAEEIPSLSTRVALSHRMFQVSLLSALRMSDGLRELEQWYIIQQNNAPERIAHVEQLVHEPEIELQTGEMGKNFDFVMQHGLYVPNTEELAKLGRILEQGHLDGYEVIKPKKKNKD